MTPYHRYRQSDPSAHWTRMDTLLALYDGALARLDKAAQALTNGDVPVATPYLSKAQLMVNEMAAGVRVDVDEEMGVNMLRLYEYVVNLVRVPRLENVRNAVKVLSTLREGFEAVRDEANRMERAGELTAADRLQLVLASA
jgi:flagellar secretion chaperone FliS